MISSKTMKLLAAAGVTMQDATAIVESMEADLAEANKRNRPSSAERTARYRARLAGQNDNETPSDASCDTQSDDASDAQSDADVTRHSPLKEYISKPPSSLRSVKFSAGEAKNWFDELWSVYPKRVGGNPKQAANEKFLRLLRASRDPATLAGEIIDGAKRYAASRQGEDGKFTPQTVRWLNTGAWKDEHEPSRASASNSNHPVGASFKPRQEGRIINTPFGIPVSETQMRDDWQAGRWPRAYGPKPGEQGCVLEASR